MGEEDVTNSLTNPDAPRSVISQQPLLGSLFKSQNGSTWDASQFEDLKFRMYRAQFSTRTTANASFYNPDMGVANGGLTKLGSNPIETISNKTTVGFGSTLTNAMENVVIRGVNLSQVNNPTATGVIIDTLGSIGIGASVDIISAGIGYTPSAVLELTLLIRNSLWIWIWCCCLCDRQCGYNFILFITMVAQDMRLVMNLVLLHWVVLLWQKCKIQCWYYFCNQCSCP